MPNYYVFDFDGVLFDTARECLDIAYQAVRSHPRTQSFAQAWKDHQDPPAKVAQAFLSHRHWVGPPWQYALLLLCIAEGQIPDSTETFLDLCARERAAFEWFTDAYFEQRWILAKDPERWFGFTQPVQEATQIFAQLYAQGSAWLLSTRDNQSIQRIFAHWTGTAIDEGRILPRSGRLEKWEILLSFAQAQKVTPARIFFLDDYLQHALPALEHVIAAHLATWGYLGPHDEQRARSKGLPCLRTKDLNQTVRLHDQKGEPV